MYYHFTDIFEKDGLLVFATSYQQDKPLLLFHPQYGLNMHAEQPLTYFRQSNVLTRYEEVQEFPLESPAAQHR